MKKNSYSQIVSIILVAFVLSGCSSSDSNTTTNTAETTDETTEDTSEITNQTSEDTTDNASETLTFENALSAYGIYQGDPGNLQPTAEYHQYDLASQLFTDYAEKQRLIKLPTGETLTKTDDGLPTMPDGTIIVKTFYYHDAADFSAANRNLVETRLLIKSSNGWIASSYVWNDDHSDAFLTETGTTQFIDFTDSDGVARSVSYEVPSQEDCAICHNNNDLVTPIGPKLANLNITVERNGSQLNQLDYFHTLGILDDADASSGTSVPNYDDELASLAERARAYIDINCAHCHNPSGFASREGIDFRYTASLADTTLANNRPVTRLLESGEMPQIGTTLIDEEGVSLVLEYIESIR